MNLIRIRAMARKESLQILRDPLSLVMAFLVPLFLLMIFGYAITFDIREIDMVIVDQDRSSHSRDLARAFEASGYFTVKAVLGRTAAIDAEIDSGRARVAVMVPPDFSRMVLARRPAQLGVVIDGSDANTATITQGYLTGIVRQYSLRLVPGGVPAPIDVRTRRPFRDSAGSTDSSPPSSRCRGGASPRCRFAIAPATPAPPSTTSGTVSSGGWRTWRAFCGSSIGGPAIGSATRRPRGVRTGKFRTRKERGIRIEEERR